MLYLGEENKGMTELPKTEQELNDLIDQKVNEATERLVAKHNGEMANMRQKHDADLKKAKEQANLSAEELANQKAKEQQEANEKELNELRSYKKTTELSQKLAKEGLPDFLKNDSRLLNAEDGNVDKVIKTIKGEFEQSLPKGARHSTVVQTQTNGSTPSGDAKQEAFGKMAEALKEIVS